MDLADILLLLVAGSLAGMINAVIGSGTLVTFPVLVAMGFPPVLANVTNTVGIFPGSVSAVVAYRRELRGLWSQVLPLAATSAVGGVIGALLLLAMPAEVFRGVVPVLIIVACILVIFGPRIKALTAARRASRASLGRSPITPSLMGVTTLTGVYGGYFGAAQGVILIGVLSIALPGDLHRANAIKNVLAGTANGAATILFIFSSQVDWLAAGVIAAGGIVGAQLGGKFGRKIPELIYRIAIVVIGVVSVANFLLATS